MSPLIYYILATLGGATLAWLALSGNKTDKMLLESEARRDKEALKAMIGEFTSFKNSAKNELLKKDSEISKLRKGSSFPDIIAKAQEKEIKHWKVKAQELEEQIKKAPAKAKSNNPKAKEIDAKLAEAKATIRDKDSEIAELKISLVSFAEQEELEEDFLNRIKKLQKKARSYKKKLKLAQAYKAEKEIIEIRETLNLKKINKLLSKGKLTKTTKKVSTKKSKAKSSAKKDKAKRQKPIPTSGS